MSLPSQHGPGPSSPPHLPVAVVDAEGNGGRVEEQPELVLKHLLLEALDGTALPLVGFLQAGRGHGDWVKQARCLRHPQHPWVLSAHPQPHRGGSGNPWTPHTLPSPSHLLLHLALDGRDLHLHVLQLVVGDDVHLRAVLRLLRRGEHQVGQGHVPLAVVLLVLPAAEARVLSILSILPALPVPRPPTPCPFPLEDRAPSALLTPPPSSSAWRRAARR